jgi:WD40 repeat protein
MLMGKIATVWDVRTRRLLATLEGHEGAITRAVFSADGKRIVTGGDDRQALLWDVATGKPLALFTGHTAAVTHVVISPDGRRVATASADGTARVWPADLLSAARQRLPRQLTPAERERYAIPAPGAGAPAPPRPPVVLPPPGATVQALLSGPRRLPAAEEAAATKRLAELRKLAGAPADQVRAGLTALRRDYPGTAPALEAAALLAKLPSPLDALDAGKIPQEERIANHPKELVAVLGEQRWRHAGTVSAVRISPDGRVIASQDDRIHLRDAKTGRLRGTLPGTLLGFIAATGQLVSHSDGHLRFWDVSKDTPRQERVIAHAHGASALSPDGKTLAEITSASAIRLWDLGPAGIRQRAVLQGHPRHGGVWVQFSADGRTLASCSRGDVVRLWDLTVPAPRRIGEIPGVARSNVAVALSPDGQRVAVPGADEVVRLWQLEAGRPRQRGVLQGTRSIGSLAFAPSGKTIAVGSGDWPFLSLWDVAGKEPRKVTALAGPHSWVHAVAFAADGSFLVSGGYDHTVRVWDLTATSGRQRFALRGHTAPVTGVAFAPDRPVLASHSEDGTLRLWDLSGGVREQAVLPAGWGPVAFSPDGRTLAAGEGQAPGRLWDVSGPAPRLRAALARQSYGVTGGYAFSGDGRVLATGGYKPILRLWDLSQPRPRESFVLPSDRSHTSLSSISLSPDGRLIAGGRQGGWGDLLLWRVTGKGLESVRMQRAEARHVLFSPDGKTLAVAGDGQEIYLWDLSSPLPVRRAVLRGHQLPGWSGIIRSLAFSPDGRLLASTAQDRRLILWDATSGTQRQQWQLPVEPKCVAFAADSRHVATGNSNGTVYVFRVGRGQQGSSPQ